MNAFVAVFWKDLLIEWRSRDRVVAMLLFSLLVVVIFNFALPGGAYVRLFACDGTTREPDEQADLPVLRKT